MQFIALLFDFLEASWLLLSLCSLGMGALYLIYKVVKDIVFSSKHNWLSKLLHILVLILVIIGGYFYWWYTYYLPAKPDTDYYEEILEEKPKASHNTKKVITVEELNKRSAHTGMDEDSMERYMQSQLEKPVPKKSVRDELNSIANEVTGQQAYNEGVKHLQK